MPEITPIQEPTFGTLVTPEAQQVAIEPLAPVDQVLAQYRQMIASKGETGGLLGQLKEVKIAGKSIILKHPGLKKAMTIVSEATPGVSVLFNVPYVEALLREVVAYPREISTGGIDWLDEHLDVYEDLVIEADRFLSKFIN